MGNKNNTDILIAAYKRAELDVYIPAKQDIRPGGTGCCSASNCTLTVQYSF